MNNKSPYGLHIWATLWAIGPVALATISVTNDWDTWVKIATCVFAAVNIFVHVNMVRGVVFTPFNGHLTAMGSLVEMVLVVAILLLSSGSVRSLLSAILVFVNITNLNILKRALNGMPDITSDNPNEN